MRAVLGGSDGARNGAEESVLFLHFPDILYQCFVHFVDVGMCVHIHGARGSLVRGGNIFTK